jgi:Derlin-2/3
MYLLLNFSQNYESHGPFNTGAGGGSADYLFMWLFGAITMMASVPVVNLITPFSGRIMCRNMIYYVLYIWSKRHPLSNSNIWGFPVKAMYLPFVYVALSVFTGAPYIYMLHGIIVGHIYYFLVDVVPHVYGKDVLTTPQFLIDQLGVGVYVPGVAPASAAPTAQANAPRGGHNWGSGGQRLGRS